MEGEQIRDVVDSLHRKSIDVEVEVAFQRREYTGTQSRDSKMFRVVGVHDEDADEYYLYMPNLPRKEFLPADVAQSIDVGGR